MLFYGESFALLTAFMWSITSIVFARATLKLGAIRVNVFRLVIAFLLLIITISLLKLDIALSSTQIEFLLISGLIGIVLGDSFLFKAFQLVGPRISMLIMSLAPAISALLAYFILNEKLTILNITGIFITIIGIALVIFERIEPTSFGKIQNKAGLFFALLGAIGQGVGLVVAKMAFSLGEINGFVATSIRLLAAIITMVPITLYTGHFQSIFYLLKINRLVLVWLLVGSITGPFLGISFSLIVVAHTKVGIAATLMSTVPIIMLPLVRIIQKEQLSLNAYIGAFVSVIGVGILFL